MPVVFFNIKNTGNFLLIKTYSKSILKRLAKDFKSTSNWLDLTKKN